MWKKKRNKTREIHGASSEWIRSPGGKRKITVALWPIENGGEAPVKWPVSQVVERSERKEERGRTKNINGMKYFFRRRRNGLIAIFGEYKRVWNESSIVIFSYGAAEEENEILEAYRIAWWPRLKEITRSRMVRHCSSKGCNFGAMEESVLVNFQSTVASLCAESSG